MIASYRARPSDARRGGVVLIAPGLAPAVRAFCDEMAQQGYEMLAVSAADLDPAFDSVVGPAFLLSHGAGGAAAWSSICGWGPAWAAACLYEPPLTALVEGEPRCPTILHLTAPREDWPAEIDGLAERRPDVRAFPYDAPPDFALTGSDAARLAWLRTLQLFHRASGVRGEMGGG